MQNRRLGKSGFAMSALGPGGSTLGIAWLLSHSEVSAVMVGTRRREQLAENVKSVNWALTPEEALGVRHGLRGI